MFEVGDRVVCVDVRPSRFTVEGKPEEQPSNLTKGHVYVVTARYPQGLLYLRGGGNLGMLCSDHIAVGVPNFFGDDMHSVRRFRKLRDISQSLSELKALTINCPPLVGVDA
jgi:hypothetical protein